MSFIGGLSADGTVPKAWYMRDTKNGRPLAWALAQTLGQRKSNACVMYGELAGVIYTGATSSVKTRCSVVQKKSMML